MLRFHASFSWFVVAANTLVGIWALASIRFRGLDQPALWYCVVIAQVAIGVEALAGIYVLSVEGRAVDDFHVFYGVIALVFIAVGYIYAIGSEWVKERRQLFYGVLSLFLMGLSIRAMLIVDAI